MYQPIIGILSDTMRHHSPIFGDIPKHYVNEKYVKLQRRHGEAVITGMNLSQAPVGALSI